MIKIMDKAEWRRRAVEHGAELAKVKKQLAIAVEALNEYAEEDNWEDCHAGFLDSPIDYGCYGYYGYQQAQEALLKIKELEK